MKYGDLTVSDYRSLGNLPQSAPESSVYFYVISEIETADTEGDAVRFAKIGYARSPIARMQGLQTANARNLYLAVAVACGSEGAARRMESEWHKRFASSRMRGEWFRWSDDLSRAVLDLKKGNATR